MFTCTCIANDFGRMWREPGRAVYGQMTCTFHTFELTVTFNMSVESPFMPSIICSVL